jgi:anti-sigma factor RsiW
VTSTTDMTGHPDVAEISDLAEGLLPPTRTAQVQRHLDDCDLCTDVHTSLREIQGLLGALPEPSPMPPEIADRIDAALAAEALLHATAAEPVTVPTPGDSDSDSDSEHDVTRTASDSGAASASPSGSVSRETPAGADRPAGHPRVAATGPGRKKRTRPGRRRTFVLGAALTAAVLGFGSVLLASLDDGTSPEQASKENSAPAADTFSADTLERQVSALLAGSASQEDPRSDAPHTLGSTENQPGATDDPRVFQSRTVPPCVQQGIGQSGTALATEPGTYDGRQALLVVLPDASDSTRVTAYLMDATCVGDPSVGKAQLLLKRSYAQP